jgi:hypothetical protein
MEKVKNLTRQIVELLVEQNYQQVVALTSGVRLCEEEISRTISQYGRTLMSPPESAFSSMAIQEVKAPRIAGVRQWAVAISLWTKEEGRSDLTVEFTILESDPAIIEIDDIHVL